MKFNKNPLLLTITACMALSLSACGGGVDGGDEGASGLFESENEAEIAESGTGTTTTGSAVNPAHTIVLTYPVTDAIENLGGGVYRDRKSVV